MKVVSTSFVISVEAGLPNITAGIISYENAFYGAYGALSASGRNGAANYHREGSTNNMIGPIKFNASKSNPVYGNSKTVTPLSLSCTVLIRY